MIHNLEDYFETEQEFYLEKIFYIGLIEGKKQENIY